MQSQLQPPHRATSQQTIDTSAHLGHVIVLTSNLSIFENTCAVNREYLDAYWEIVQLVTGSSTTPVPARSRLHPGVPSTKVRPHLHFVNGDSSRRTFPQYLISKMSVTMCMSSISAPVVRGLTALPTRQVKSVKNTRIIRRTQVAALASMEAVPAVPMESAAVRAYERCRIITIRRMHSSDVVNNSNLHLERKFGAILVTRCYCI